MNRDPLAVHPLIAGARALIPKLAQSTVAHERDGRLVPEAVAALRDGGHLSALLPEPLGGQALPPAQYVQMLAALAQGDAACAWCTMTASTSSLLAGYMDRAAASSIWTSGAVPFLAGVFAPSGIATPEPDGSVRLIGRWSYASGSRHADYFALGALLERGHITCILDAKDVQIIDNWDTLGLAGTGSHDVAVEGMVVPASRIAVVFGREPWPEEPLYRVPLFGLLALGVAACALGVAQGALAATRERLVSGGKAEPPSALLAVFAREHAAVAAAEAYLLATAARAESAAAQGAVSDAVRGELRLAAAEVALTSARVVRSLFHLGGGASIRSGNSVERALRDIETILTHRMVADRILPAAARAVLGVGTAPPDL